MHSPSVHNSRSSLRSILSVATAFTAAFMMVASAHANYPSGSTTTSDSSVSDSTVTDYETGATTGAASLNGTLNDENAYDPSISEAEEADMNLDSDANVDMQSENMGAEYEEAEIGAGYEKPGSDAEYEEAGTATAGQKQKKKKMMKHRKMKRKHSTTSGAGASNLAPDATTSQTSGFSSDLSTQSGAYNSPNMRESDRLGATASGTSMDEMQIQDTTATSASSATQVGSNVPGANQTDRTFVPITRSEQAMGANPHIGITTGYQNVKGDVNSAIGFGIDAGVSIMSPLTVGLTIQYSPSDLNVGELKANFDTTNYLARANYHFGGDVRVIKDTFVGWRTGLTRYSGATEANTHLALGPVLGMNFKVDKEAKLTLGPELSYLTVTGAPDQTSLQGALRYWF